MNVNTRGIRLATALMVAFAAAGATVAAQTGGSIKVHGHWTLDVHNADGSLASHAEFENELTPLGGGLLGILLHGTAVVRELVVELDGSVRPCGNTPCLIVPPNEDFTNPNSPFYYGRPGSGASPTLSVAGQTTGQAKLVLAGLATTGNGKIGIVRTKAIPFCPPSPATCDPALAGLFSGFPSSSVLFPLTERALQTEITVTSGQVVSVSVTLTFTS